VSDDELPPGGEILGDDPPWDAWRPEEIAGPLLDPAARAWPGWALRRVHPGHRRIATLEPG